MNISREDIDQLNAKIVIDIEQADYLDELNTKLREYQSKANLKGFRKGKTPMGFVKKIYGQSAMEEVVLSKFQYALNDYINDNEIKLVGYALPTEDQEPLEFNIKEPGVYSFSFDIGLMPDMEVKGIDETATYDYDDVTIPDEDVDEEIQKARNQLGTYEEVEDEFGMEDRIHIEAVEMEGEVEKKDGWVANFDVLVQDIADEALQKRILACKNGDAIGSFDIYKMDKHLDEKATKKYLLEMSNEEMETTEVNAIFSGSIIMVERLVPSKIDEDFFKRFFGVDTEIDTLDAAKDHIRGILKSQLQNSADNMLFNTMYERLLEENTLELPSAFIERWLTQEHKGHDHPIDVQGFEKQLKWTVIMNKIVEEYKVEVKEEEVIQAIRQKVQGMLGYYGANEQFVEIYMRKFLENGESLDRAYQETMSQKAFEALKQNVTLNKVKISKDDFLKKIDAENEKMKQKEESENHSHDH